MKERLVFLFLLLLFFASNFGFSNEQQIKKKIRVYFSAKVSKPQYKNFNLEVRNSLFNENYQVFMPQQLFIPELEFETIEKCAYEVDKAAINWSDIVLLLSPYGKDCSWEIGYARGINKLIIAYLTDKESIKDSMIMGSINLILTSDPEIMNILTKDDRTKGKSVFCEKGCSHDLIKNFYDKETLLNKIVNNWNP